MTMMIAMTTMRVEKIVRPNDVVATMAAARSRPFSKKFSRSSAAALA